MWSWVFDLGNSIFRQSHADFLKAEVFFLNLHFEIQRHCCWEEEKANSCPPPHQSPSILACSGFPWEGEF